MQIKIDLEQVNISHFCSKIMLHGQAIPAEGFLLIERSAQ